MVKQVFDTKNEEIKDLVVRREFGKKIAKTKAGIRMASKQLANEMVRSIPDDQDGSYKVSVNITIKDGEVWLDNVSIKATK